MGFYRSRPEPLAKRVIAWCLLFSFFFQCAPVAAWALPVPEPTDPQPTNVRDLLPQGLPSEVMPRLPNPLAEIQDRDDAYSPELAQLPEPSTTPTPTPSATPEPSVTPSPTVTPTPTETPMSEADNPEPSSSPTAQPDPEPSLSSF